jgi:hypothetical protein
VRKTPRDGLMEIDLKQMKVIVNRLLDHLIETRGVSKVELDRTYYWNIPQDLLYNVCEQPNGLDIGSLSDDWEFISSLLDEDTEPVAYQLTEVAPLLRYIGEALGEQLAGKGG